MSEIKNDQSSAATQPDPGRPRSLLIGAFFLAYLAVAFGYLVFSRERAVQEQIADVGQPDTDPRISQFDWKKELQEALALADHQDPGWRLAQLEEKRATVPDEKNSALVILEARKLLPDSWPAWLEKDETPISDEILWNLEPPVQLEARLTEALREELRLADKALITVRKVRSMPSGSLSD